MKYKESLYNLVKSLNGPEKSYFKKYAKRHTGKGKNVYLRLFELLDGIRIAEDYDEKCLRDGLKSYTVTTNLSVLKSYLYKMILKSMKAYHIGLDTASLVNEDLENFRFLFMKNHFKEAGQVLRKAKKTATEYESFEKLFEILKKERLLVKKTDPANIELLKKINREAIDASAKIKSDAEYYYLNDIILALVSKYGVGDYGQLKERFEKIFESRYLRNIKLAKSFYSILFFYQIHVNYQFIHSKYDKCLELFRTILLHFESKPAMIKLNPRSYAVMVLNCLDMCEILRYYNLYDMYYKKLTDLMENSSINIPATMRLSIMSRMYIIEIKKFTNIGEFDENKEEIKEIEASVDRDFKKIDPVDRVILIFQFAMYYFGCRNYNGSLKWLNMILNKEEEIRGDLRIECRLLFLIIHFELGNYDFLEYAVKSTYRYLLRLETPRGIEPLILYFIRKAAAISNTNDLRELFEDLYRKMKKNPESLEEYGFKYVYWVESKLSGASYGEIMKRRYIEGRSKAENESGGDFTINYESKKLRENLEVSE